jgi:hypothetical protein
MDSLIARIIQEIMRPYHRLSIITNPDGFLRREDTIRAFTEQTDIAILCFTQLELRIWYETEFAKSEEQRFIVILEDTSHLVADIRLKAFVTEFKTRDLLLSYNQQAIDLNKMNYQMLAHLFETKSVAILDRDATDKAVVAAESLFGADGDDISVVKANLMQVVMDWHKPQKTIEQISKQVVKAARQGKYAEIETEVEFLNLSFQRHLNDVYYQQLITATGPRVVHKILPYIERTYGIGQKLALVVVDGLAYWQYLVLKALLSEEGIETEDNVCYAWMPSVTQLSRQAIFRGSVPERTYKQNPTNEEKLWKGYWLERNFEEWHVMYAHEDLSKIPALVERLAYVTMTMDDDMHSAHGMKQLYRSTEDWVKGFVAALQNISSAGFDIILTADHGGVPSKGWGNLTTQEKAALYETGSRGLRHLIFSNQSTMQHFLESHPNEVQEWMIRGDSIVWRNNKCFGNDDCITHGGSHMLELLVPLVTIKRQ